MKRQRCAIAALYAGCAILIGFGAREEIGTVSLSASPSPAEQQRAERIAGDIAGVAPAPGAVHLVATSTSGALHALGEGFATAIPSSDFGWLELGPASMGTSSAALRIGLPHDDAEQRAVLSTDGTATFAGSVAATDLAVQAFARGVRIQTVMNDEAAPTELRYPVELPTGSELRAQDDGGIAVVDNSGRRIARFAAPWARDRNGRDVATRYAIREGAIIQTIDHRHEGVTYPVVADPWLWMDLIAKAKWTGPAGHRTLEVTPTQWARDNPGNPLVGEADWAELYHKYRRQGLTRNLDSMKKQLICHQVIVAVADPDKPTWNLDEWRPDVDYATLVRQRCNPGAGARNEEE